MCLRLMSREVAIEVSASGIVPKGSNKKCYRVGCSFPAYLLESPAWSPGPEEFHSSIMIWKRV